MKTIIHVNQQIIVKNRTTGSNDAPLTVKDYTQNRRCHTADILDQNGNLVAQVKHSPHKPLSCGARVWVETYNEVVTHAGEIEEIEGCDVGPAGQSDQSMSVLRKESEADRYSVIQTKEEGAMRKFEVKKSEGEGYTLTFGSSIMYLTDLEYLDLYQSCARSYSGYTGAPSGPPYVVTVKMDYQDVDANQTTQDYAEPVPYDTLEEANSAIAEANEVIEALGVTGRFHVYLEKAPYLEYSHLQTEAESAKELVLALYAGWEDGVNNAEDGPEDGFIMQHEVFLAMTAEERQKLYDFVLSQQWG